MIKTYLINGQVHVINDIDLGSTVNDQYIGTGTHFINDYLTGNNGLVRQIGVNEDDFLQSKGNNGLSFKR